MDITVVFFFVVTVIFLEILYNKGKGIWRAPGWHPILLYRITGPHHVTVTLGKVGASSCGVYNADTSVCAHSAKHSLLGA